MRPVLTASSEDGRPDVELHLRDFTAKHSAMRGVVLEHYAFRVAPWGVLAWLLLGTGAADVMYSLPGLVHDFRLVDLGALLVQLGVTVLVGIVAVRATSWPRPLAPGTVALARQAAMAVRPRHLGAELSRLAGLRCERLDAAQDADSCWKLGLEGKDECATCEARSVVSVVRRGGA